MASLDAYFQAAIDNTASDLHLVGDEIPMIRVAGALQPIAKEPLPNDKLEQSVLGLLTADQKERFASELELDMGYAFADNRFRVNIHRQSGSIGLAARLVPDTIPAPEELGFTDKMLELPQLLDGLVLVVGPTGHGKSTTLAAMIDQINKTRKAHIVTVEDPIEFHFNDDKSLIEQREIGQDTHSFANALKHVLRQDPDVILVGEMRDPETIATVLTAAETGHLVFSTLHTSSAAEAIERIVDVFDGAKQRQVLIQLASVLRVVVAQQLIPSTDGGRVAAREVLINTPAVANLIRENNIAQMKSVIQTGVKAGMTTMENAIKELVKEKKIDKDIAERRLADQATV